MISLQAQTNAERSPALAQPELKDSPQRWWLAVLLNIGLLFCYVHRSSLSVAAPFMIKDLGFSTAVMGILLSAFFWPYAFLQTPAGWVVDRFGVRRSYGIGYLLGSLASAAAGFASNLGSLILLRMILGVGQSAVFPASSRATANWFREYERGLVTALYLAGNRLGQALINGIGTLLLVAIGWQMFFFATGVVPLLWLLPWMWFLRRWDGTVGSGTRPVEKSEASFFESFALLRQRSALGIFLGFFAYDYVWFLYLTWLPGYLRLERGFSVAEMAVLSSVPYIIGLVITLVSGTLSDWFVRRGYNEVRVRKTFIIVGLSIACLIVPAGMVEDKMTAVYLLTISLCGLNICGPNTWSLTQAVCEKRIVGTMAGNQNFGGNVGGIIAPALTGFIAYKTQSFAIAMGIAGLILIGGILAYSLMVSKKVVFESRQTQIGD
jgi:MFS transporter, ACS family, D-galactonate transporter